MFMNIAKEVSKRSTCKRRKVGAVLIQENRIVSIGYNGSPSGLPHCEEIGCYPEHGCQRTVHAESNCIAFAARKGIMTEGSVIFTTLSPCKNCAKLLINAGIKEIVYDQEYRITEGIELLKEANIVVYNYLSL